MRASSSYRRAEAFLIKGKIRMEMPSSPLYYVYLYSSKPEMNLISLTSILLISFTLLFSRLCTREKCFLHVSNMSAYSQIHCSSSIHAILKPMFQPLSLTMIPAIEIKKCTYRRCQAIWYKLVDGLRMVILNSSVDLIFCNISMTF